MRLSELRAREDLDAILQRTLARDFSERLGQPVTVTAGGTGQRWLVQPTLSAFYTRGICAAARRHLRDDFRWTPVRRRIPAQFALGTALASLSLLLWVLVPLWLAGRAFQKRDF